MTLHEAIQKVLIESNNLLSARKIADIINSRKYYIRTDREDLTSSQILSRVKNYPLLFQNINGQILLLEENNFKNIITSYSYLTNLLRGIYIPEDIQFIIAVLFFYKRLIDINEREGRRYPINHYDEMENSINRLIDGGNRWLKNIKELDDFYLGPEGIFEECSRLLLKLDNYKKVEIWQIISQLETSKIVDEEFGNIYDFFINSSSLEGFKSYEFHTSESLKRLMVELLSPSEGKSIYDPVAGSGSLLIQALKFNSTNNDISKGTEINKRIAQLGNMNLIMNGLKNYQIEAKDCFDEINNSNQYDYIIADLPINGITNSYEHFILLNQYGLKVPKSGKGFSSLVLFVLSRLKPNGKAVITVSDNFLTSKGKEKDIRKLLIDNDFIESIVSLPVGALRPHTDAKASIIVINKEKKANLTNKIKFIKAKAIDLDKKSMLINNDAVLKSYFNELDYSKNSQVVDINDLRTNYNISVEAYDDAFIISNVMLNEGTGKLLADLVEIKAGTQPDKNDISDFGEISLVKIENLSREILNINLSKELNHSVEMSPKYSRYIIHEDCIIVARIGDNLKPTIYKHNNENKPIMLHSGVYALIPSKRKNKLSLEYLYYQLYSAFVLEQIKSKKLGAVMPYISIASLSQIVIPYVDLEFQKSFVDSQRANLITEEKARFEERFKELGYIEDAQEKELNIVRTITHQLKHHLTGLSTILDKINAISINNNLGDLKEYNEADQRLITAPGFELAENNNLKEIIKKAIKKADSVNNILKDVEKAIIFTLEYSEIQILELLKEIKKEYKDKSFVIEVTGDNTTVEISKTHFEDLINTLIENAEEHSFKDIKNPKVSFNIKTDFNRELIIIDYKNNGIPMSITEKEYKSILTKSIKSNGTGIGGYYINKIVEAHKGSLKIIENLNPGVHFTIELPIKHYESE